jgi:NAD(P)-dependent dehydrogenase (short-subunit alcohol dehydrogenase family)
MNRRSLDVTDSDGNSVIVGIEPSSRGMRGRTVLRSLNRVIREPTEVSDMRIASFDFSDETVIVTGGSSGIGRGIALAFGSSGARVLNADVQEEPKDVDARTPTHEAIREHGGSAAFVETDVSDPDEIRALIETADEFGGVDVMVNNAGINYDTSFHEITESEFERIHEVNVKGAENTCAVAGELGIERIIFTSTAAVYGIPERNPVSDEHEGVNDSAVLAEIAEQRGWDDEDIHSELEARKRVLRYLLTEDMAAYQDVTAVVSTFAKDPEFILDEIEAGTLDPSTLPVE